MNNIALIFAGGTGQRMNVKTGLPKQFLKINGIPIIIRTIELFAKHSMIDGVIIVCIHEYIDKLKDMISEYKLNNKIISIVVGADSAFNSIRNGLNYIYKNCDTDSVVLIHDGVRPLITPDEITENIKCVYNNGNAITVSNVIESVMYEYKMLNRDKCLIAKAPQSFYFKEIYNLHQLAFKDSLEFIDSASLASYYDYKLYFTTCSNLNIKITTPIDFYLAETIIKARETENIFGL